MKTLIAKLLLFFVVVFAVNPALAATIVMQQQVIPGWNDTRTTNVELWIFSQDQWIDAAGQVHLPGSMANRTNVQRVTGLTVNTGARTLTIPQFNLTSTTDALQNARVQLSAYIVIVNAAGVPVQSWPYVGFEQGFRVPSLITSSSGCGPAGTCATWYDLSAINRTPLPYQPQNTYTTTVIDQKIAAVGLPLTTKGDLPGYSGSATGRLPVGANGLTLIADSTQPLGFRWGSAGGGTWGGIGGLLTDQSDLNTALSGKVPTTRTISTSAPLTGGGALSGNLTLSLNGSVPTSVTNDTNLNGSITLNVLTLTWSGALAKSRQYAGTVYNDQNNTFGNFIQTFQAGANHLLVDPTDTTKKFQFDVSNVGTSTTRTVNIPNANSTTVQADTGAANQFLTAISAQGVISKAQPSFSNLVGALTSGQDYTTGVGASTYRSVSVNTNGRITAGTNPTTFGGYSISDTSANLLAALTDETGGGLAVFNNTPSLTTPTIAGGALSGAFTGNPNFTGNPKFGSGTNFTETGQASQGTTTRAFFVADGSTGTPISSDNPTVIWQRVDSTNNNTSVIDYMMGGYKKSGNGDHYVLHSFLRSESPDLRDGVAIGAYVFADPSSTPGSTQTFWSFWAKTERNKVGVRVSPIELGVVNSATTSQTGTVTVSSGGTSITGSGTTFTNHVIGDTILISSSPVQYATLSAIADATHATTNAVFTFSGGATSTFQASASAVAYSIGANAVYDDTSANATFGGNIVSTGPGRNAFGLRFQKGTPSGPFIAGLTFGLNSIFSYGVDFNDMGVGISGTPARPIRFGNSQYEVWRNNAGSADKRFVTLTTGDVWNFDPDALGSTFNAAVTTTTNFIGNTGFANKVVVGAAAGQETYPGIWFLAAATAPSLSNYGFLADLSVGSTVLNATNAIELRIANAGLWALDTSAFYPEATTNTLDLGKSSFRIRNGFFGTSVESAVFKTTTALITSTGGSNPTFGTNFIGGTGGPATAAQNGWMKMQDSGGATVWVPVWK